MAERTFAGYPVHRVTIAVIAVGMGISALTMLLADEELILYSGVAVGVGMVVASGVVSYVAARQAEGK